MANFCLIPSVADEFKKNIISGKINPQKLSAMTSKERHAFFAKELGESNAAPVNALFESKLLLKNQQQGMITWAKRVMGQNKVAQRDIISRIQRMEKILSPEEESLFLEDLVAERMGTRISHEEAAKIADLSAKVEEAKTAMESGGDRLKYGKAVVELNEYVNKLKLDSEKMSLSDIKRNPVKAFGKALNSVAGNAKAINTSLDNSAIFRQGWKTLWTNPVIWKRNAQKTFVDIFKTFGGKDVMRELNADIVSRPNYELMKKAKLDVGVTEEAYPTSFPEKIPVAGRVYKASQDAYTAFIHKTRADVFDKYIEIAKKTGVELTNEELLSIGKLTNSLTGRGHLGRAEPLGGPINNIFFSGRLLKSHFDVLLTHPIGGAGGSNFVRKQAALNLLKIIMGTAAVLAIAKALDEDSVELDPRSSDFGKIKVGATRFDVTGGMGSIITLATRWAKSESKSSTTGKITELNARSKNGKPVYGGKTKGGVIADFLTNKLSPVASVVNSMWVKGSDFEGKKPTFGSVAKQLFVPMPIKTFEELKSHPDSANIVMSMILEALGISTNTY